MKELLALKVDSVVFDVEVVGYDCKGKVVKSAVLKEQTCEEIPREDTAELTVGKIPPEAELGYVFHVHDLLYLNGEPYNNKPYSERLATLKKILPRNLQFFSVMMSSPIVKTPGDFKRWVNKLRTVKGSEGVMLKVATSIYPIKVTGENRTPEWAKLKNMKSIEVIVHKVIPKVYRKGPKKGQPIPGIWMYDTAIRIPKEEIKHWKKEHIITIDDKVYAHIGRTFATKVKAKVGDIIEVLVGRIREYVRDNIHTITWMFPKFREVRVDKKEPDTLDTARKLAKVGPEFIERLFERVIIFRLPICPYNLKYSFCIIGKIFRKPRVRRHLLSIIKREYLRFPVICKLAFIFRCRYLKKYYYGLERINIEEKEKKQEG